MLEQQTRTCSDKQKKQQNQGSDLLRTCAFVFQRKSLFQKIKIIIAKKNLDEGGGLYVNRPHDPRQNNGKQEQREQSSSSYWLTSNLVHGSGVQSFLLQKPQQIRRKKTILTLQHDFGMPNSSSGP